MTKHRSFKRLVRARMDKTNESYTAARAALLTAADTGVPDEADQLRLATSDDSIRSRTGRGWEEWFDRSANEIRKTDYRATLIQMFVA